MFKRLIEFLNEYLRINAIRRMLTMVEIRWSEAAGLVVIAVLSAVFEGVGLSLLLPILQYAEGGTAALNQNSGVFWVALNGVLRFLHLPMNLPVLLGLAFVPILMRQAVFYWNAWYSAVVSGRIGVRMRMQTVDTVFNADPEYFTRYPAGHLVGIILGQTGAAGAAVLAVVRLLTIVLLMLLYVGILMVISIPLTAITALFAIIISVSVRVHFTRITQFGVEAARIGQEMMGKVFERFTLMRLIKLRDQKKLEAERIEQLSETMVDIGIKQARLGAMVEVTADPLLMLSIFVTLYVGIAVLGMTLAELGLLLFLLNRLNAKIKEFNGGRQAISANMAGLLLVREATDDALASNTILSGAQPFVGLRDTISLEQVSFTYPDTKEPDGSVSAEGKTVLHDVSVSIPAGSFAAIVGRSGAGKSTLVELLPRLRDATGGTITFDGVDVREFQVGSLRKGIGYLTQNPMLFNDTVRENLIYGLDQEPSEDQIRDALERAYAMFVYDLPRGLETGLGDRGVRFSGGEAQRLGLARVLLQDTSIIVLDEPTSALDSESEYFIQQALRRLHGDKTIIVIAHRLATVIQADQLLVIEDGRVVERGAHEELVTHDGAYRKLFETQLLA